MKHNSQALFELAGISAAVLALVACGGGGSSVSAPAAAATTLSGSVVKGPVAGAPVTVKKASDGTVLKTATTGTDGSYTRGLVGAVHIAYRYSETCVANPAVTLTLT